MIAKTFRLPCSVLEDSPGRLFFELRRGVTSIRRQDDLPQESQLLDIGFRRIGDVVEVTVFFDAR